MADDAHGEAAGHSVPGTQAEIIESAEAGMPQLNPEYFPNLIFWLIVSIVLLYMILSKVAIPRITSVLAERSDAISGDLETAQLYKRRAEEAEAAYTKALAEAREEAMKIAAESKAEVNKEVAVMIEKADAEIAAKAAESEARIAEIRENAARSVEEVAKATALEIVSAIAPVGTADEASVESAVSGQLRG
ncbi:MAG: F0F1 ATP synthase subunit B' [Pseudomonadota bacterium]